MNPIIYSLTVVENSNFRFPILKNRVHCPKNLFISFLLLYFPKLITYNQFTG